MFYVIYFISCLLYGVQSVVVNTTYYPKFHLAPLHGWMNDPNGFCIFKNEYHLFYQYNPKSSLEPGVAHWGHAKSKDLFSWEHLPIAVYPDQWYDKVGAFSGSAIVEDDVMYVFYTGNTRLNNNTQQKEYQVLATSTDGVNLNKQAIVISAADCQPEIRDPKVWKHGDKYYMVLGNSFKSNGKTLGQILMYTSLDKLNWNKVGILDASNGTLGYMYECPDLFPLNGLYVLLFSPQGVKPQGDKYKNLFQTGYFLADFDYNTDTFTRLSDFYELDHGHDFYASQTLEHPDGRRIVVAWVDTWAESYPEEKHGWTGHISIPREVSLRTDGLLLQKPVKEIQAVRGRSLYYGRGEAGQVVKLENNAAEVNIIALNDDFTLFIESQGSSTPEVTITYDKKTGKITLNRGGNDAIRRTDWVPLGYLKWQIFIDSSCIELFCGDGEVTFTSRFFPSGLLQIRLGNKSVAEQLSVIEMRRTVPLPPTLSLL